MHTSVKYASIDQAIQMIKRAGQGCFLAKTDIKNAFHVIPIQPGDYGLLWMQWRGLYYYDRCMPMGCSSSCLTFETFSTAVEGIARNKLSIPYVTSPGWLPFNSSFPAALSTAVKFVFVALFLSWYSHGTREYFWPCHHCLLLALNLTLLMETRLPRDKIDKCISLILNFLRRKKVTLMEVQSLANLLNFACFVVRLGRAFLRRLIDLTLGIRSPGHKIRLNREVKEDLQLRSSFLSNSNGWSFFLDENWLCSTKTEPLYRCIRCSWFRCNFWVSLVLWEVAS